MRPLPIGPDQRRRNRTGLQRSHGGGVFGLKQSQRTSLEIPATCGLGARQLQQRGVHLQGLHPQRADVQRLCQPQRAHRAQVGRAIGQLVGNAVIGHSPRRGQCALYMAACWQHHAAPGGRLRQRQVAPDILPGAELRHALVRPPQLPSRQHAGNRQL